MNISRK